MSLSAGELIGTISYDSAGAVRTFVDLTNKSTSLQANFVKLSVVGSAAFAVLTYAVTDFATQAANKLDVAEAFAIQFGTSTEKGLKILQSATKGTVDDMDLMAASNKAAFQGVTNDVHQLAAVWELARAKSKETGQDINSVFDQLVVGITTGSTRILKQFNVDLPDGLTNLGNNIDSASKKQIILNQVLEASQNALTQYESQTISAADRIKQFNIENQNSVDQIGNDLLPVYTKLLRVATPVVETFSAFVQEHPDVVRGFVAIATAIATTAVVTGTLGTVIPIAQSFFTVITSGAITSQAALGLLGVALVVVGAIFANYVLQEMEIKDNADKVDKSLDLMGESGKDAASQIGAGADQAAQKLADLQKQIDEENQAYQDQAGTIMRAREEDLRKSKESLADEEKAYLQKQKEMEKAYQNKIKSQQEQNQTALRDLETSLGKSLIVGSSTYNQDKSNYQAAIKEQMQDNQDKLDDVINSHNDELQDAKTTYEEKTNILKKTIEEDESFLQKHAEFQYTLNVEVQKDELDKLSETHQKRLQALSIQYDTEQRMNQSFNNVLGDQNKKAANEATDLIKDTISNMKDLFGDAIQKMINDGGDTVKDFFKNLMHVGTDVAAYVAAGLDPGTDFQQSKDAKTAFLHEELDKLIPTHHAGGVTNFSGGMSLVNERGPEIIDLPPGSNVHPYGTGRGAGNGTTNYNTINIDNSVDWDTFQRRLFMKLKIQ